MWGADIVPKNHCFFKFFCHLDRWGTSPEFLGLNGYFSAMRWTPSAKIWHFHTCPKTIKNPTLTAFFFCFNSRIYRFPGTRIAQVGEATADKDEPTMDDWYTWRRKDGEWLRAGESRSCSEQETVAFPHLFCGQLLISAEPPCKSTVVTTKKWPNIHQPN